MADCLVGCIGEKQCGQLAVERGLLKNSNTLSPMVKVEFIDLTSGSSITVGNKSFPSRSNNAVIKSFEYGSSDGNQCKIEILDQEGGAFSKFFKDIIKCIDATSESNIMRVQFGWIGANCNNRPIEPFLSRPMQFTLYQMETNFSGGAIKFTAIGNDSMQMIFTARETEAKGGDKVQKMPLKQAIRKLFSDSEPKIKNVRFLKKQFKGNSGESNCSGGEWEFNKGGCEGPRESWRSNNQNKLATVMEWLEPFRTKDDKGVTPTWDSEKGELIFWEDFTPTCNEDLNCRERSLGTYIVNGGKCSTVLSFSPKINWTIAIANKMAVGGQTSSDTHRPVVKENKIPGGEDCNVQNDKAGLMQSVPTSAQSKSVYGTEKAAAETSKSQQAHAKAASLSENIFAIEAELRIIGNPSQEFISTNYAGRTCSIVVINPFHIFDDGGSCGEWLARPGCNDRLSNKAWFVTGVNHHISDGSYTTTLKVSLMAPGIDLAKDRPLGGTNDGSRDIGVTC